MGPPPSQPCVPSQKKRMRYDDGDALVLGFKKGSCLMGTPRCAPIPIDEHKRKRNDDADSLSNDFPFSKRTRFQPPISRSSESSSTAAPAIAPPSKDGPSPAPAPPSEDGPSPAPPSKDGPSPAPAPRIMPVNREEEEDEDEDGLLVTLVEVELELSEPLDKMVFHNKRHRAAVLRYRFAETILKARDDADDVKLKDFKRQQLEEIFRLVSEARRREKHKRKQMEEEDPEFMNILTKLKRLKTTAGGG